MGARRYGLFECKTTAAQCYEDRYAKLARLKRDRFAVSAYPHMVSQTARVAQVPGDYFTRAAERGGERALIAETGWNATPTNALMGMDCKQAFAADPYEQTEYLELLLKLAQERNLEVVTWWSNRDLLVERAMTECPCRFDAQWCGAIDVFRKAFGNDPVSQYNGELIFKVWGTMGIRDYTGRPREPIFSRWNEVRAIPFAR